METQAICVNEGSLGAEIKCHVQDLGFQVLEIPAKERTLIQQAHWPLTSGVGLLIYSVGWQSLPYLPHWVSMGARTPQVCKELQIQSKRHNHYQ